MKKNPLESGELKFLMDMFDLMQDLKSSNPADANLPDIEKLFVKHANDSFAFQKLRLSDIKELAIEDIIRKQATDFYSSIPYYSNFPQQIQEQLISDYYQMEHQRRRDNFERFTQCIYQQIEGIVTHLWSLENSKKQGILWKYIIQKRTNKTFANRVLDPNSNKFFLDPFKSGFTIQNVIFNYKLKNYFSDIDYDNYFNLKNLGHLDSKNHFQVKLKACLYVLYFEENVLHEQFEDFFNSLYEIITIRNTFHRGHSTFNPKQQSIINNINQNKSSYYHKFYGVYSDFILRVLNSTNINIF